MKDQRAYNILLIKPLSPHQRILGNRNNKKKVIFICFLLLLVVLLLGPRCRQEGEFPTGFITGHSLHAPGEPYEQFVEFQAV